MSTPPDSFDVLVVGGGMVGSVQALALAQSGFKVALLERGGRPQPSGANQLRFSAISPASARLLSNLDVWPRLSNESFSPYEKMSVWDTQGPGRIEFDCANYASDALGYIASNNAIQIAAWSVIEETSLITVMTDVSPSAFSYQDNRAVVTLDGSQTLAADLVIAADGSNSRTRQLAGIASKGWKYDQHAVVANITHALPHESCARQAFLPDGPLAFLPLADGQSSIVWTTTPEHAASLISMARKAFLSELQIAMGDTLGEMQAVGERASFPLALGHALHYIKDGIALVGDAAHRVHPLAGQGVNLGFMDVAVLSEILAEARSGPIELGSVAVLRRYERRRRSENLPLMAGLDLIQKIFSRHVTPFYRVRSAGLSFADHIPMLKYQFVQQASGLTGTEPQLMKV